MTDSLPALDLKELEEYRQQHIGRLFLKAHRAFSERSIEKLARLGHTGLSLAHTTLLAHLDLQGTRITTLAERAGVSKQAMGSLVLELEEKGYVERLTDNEDRRATLIKFTKNGWQFLQDAQQVKREIVAEYSAILGEEGLQTLYNLLNKLLENQVKT